MNLKAVLTRAGFPHDVLEIFDASGIKDLYPPQAEAIEAGVLEGKNILLAVPTAAGKTLVAELCILKSILLNNGRCLYIAPLKALAGEKHDDFTRKYSGLGIKVGLATGDVDTPGHRLNQQQILIATAEKIDALLRARAKWLINTLNVVVLDEIHFINDGSRGPTLEILTARIRQLNPQAQILALSATVKNAQDIAQWLDARAVESAWRPIPLREGVYCAGEIKFHNGASRLIREDPPDDISRLTLDTLKGKGQVLIFVNSRRSAQAAGRQISPHVDVILTPEEKRSLEELARKAVGSSPDATKICRALGDVIRHGVAFHHAGLKPQQRQLIEENFKKNLIKTICSTPTLAAGVNLPARRAIIRDCKRFESGLGSSFIPVSEYKQCAGRAGRPQYDPYGEAVLIAKTSGEAKALLDRYIKAGPEPVISKLGTESALRFHILAAIAGGYVHDMNDAFEFLSHTFLARQNLIPNLLAMIGDVFDFLNDEGFIEKTGFRFMATPFGQCTSRLYIDPDSSIILRDGLKKIQERPAVSDIGLLHMTVCCPDSALLKVSHTEISDVEFFLNDHRDELIITRREIPLLADFVTEMAAGKTTMLLSEWVEEEKEETLCDQFGIGPGDIYRHMEATLWLLHAAITFAELFQFKNLTWPLAKLKNRVQYGVKEELTELTQLKGVGRVRARSLFNKGFKTLSDLKYVSAGELAEVDKIGRSLAVEILDQLSAVHKS